MSGASDELDVALMETVLLGALRNGSVLRSGVCGRLRAVAMVFRAGGFWRGLSGGRARGFLVV